MREVYAGLLIVVFVLFIGVLGERSIQGAGIKTMAPDIATPKHWVERRFICDLPNRQDCIDCCSAVKEFTKGPAAIVDFESCTAGIPPNRVDAVKNVWEDCIRVKSGLPPKHAPPPAIEAPQQILPLAPYSICSLLTRKPQRPAVFFPYHPVMVASVVC